METTKMRDELNEVKKPITGTSRDYAIKMLREKRPDLLDAVLNNEVSANRAMINAGLRKSQISVPLDPSWIDLLDVLADARGVKRTRVIKDFIKKGLEDEMVDVSE